MLLEYDFKMKAPITVHRHCLKISIYLNKTSMNLVHNCVAICYYRLSTHVGVTQFVDFDPHIKKHICSIFMQLCMTQYISILEKMTQQKGSKYKKLCK